MLLKISKKLKDLPLADKRPPLSTSLPNDRCAGRKRCRAARSEACPLPTEIGCGIDTINS